MTPGMAPVPVSGMRTILAVAESSQDVQMLAEQGILPATGGLVVCGAGAAKACRERGLRFDHLDLWKRFEDVRPTLRDTKNIATNWWRRPEVLELCPWLADFRGMILGECLELVFSHVVAAALSALKASRRLLVERAPDAVALRPASEPAGDFWCGFWVNPKLRAMEQAARALGIPVLHMGQAGTEVRAGEPWQPPVVLERATDESLDGLRGRVLVHAEDRHADRLMPLFRHLHEHRPGDFLYLSQDMSSGCREFLAGAGEVPFDPLRLLEPADIKEIVSVVSSARAAKERLWAVSTHWIEDRADCGEGLWNLIRFQFEWFVERGLPEVLLRLAVADRVMARLSPKLMFTSIDTSVNDLCWIYAARKWATPSLSLIHGTLYPLPLPEFWGTAHADVLAVWGPMTREWYELASARPSGGYPCVGFPVFEGLATEFAGLDRDALMRRASLDPSRPVVGLLLSMAGGGMEQMHLYPEALLGEVFRGLSGVEGAQILMRGHPVTLGLQDVDRSAFSGLDPLFRPELSMLEFLRVCDVVVAQPTTVVHEAMLLGIPVIHCAVHMAEELQWWRQDAQLAYADDGDQLRSTLNALLAGGPERGALLDGQHRFNERMLGPVDGRACFRFLNVLDSVTAVRADSRTDA